MLGNVSLLWFLFLGDVLLCSIYNSEQLLINQSINSVKRKISGRRPKCLSHRGRGHSAEVRSHPPSQDWLAEQVTEVSAG